MDHNNSLEFRDVEEHSHKKWIDDFDFYMDNLMSGDFKRLFFCLFSWAYAFVNHVDPPECIGCRMWQSTIQQTQNLQLVNNKDNCADLVMIGMSFSDKGDYKEAIRCFEKSNNIFTNSIT